MVFQVSVCLILKFGFSMLNKKQGTIIMHKRYIDHGIYLRQLKTNDHWVKCLKCHQPNILKYRHREDLGRADQNQFLFTCSQCGFHLDSHDQHSRYKLDGQYYISKGGQCHRCGGAEIQAEQRVLDIRHPPAFLQAECRLCHTISKFPTQAKDVYFIPNDKTTVNESTIFGLELYLCTATRFGYLYVYNPEHLQILKAYIQADLRERMPNVGTGYYFNCLPAWIKSARNRKEILKAILRLEQMSSTMPPFHTFNNSEPPS